MAMKAGNADAPRVYRGTKGTIRTLKDRCERAIVRISSDTPSTYLLELYEHLVGVRVALNNLSSIPGIVEEAQGVEGDSNYNVLTEAAVVIAALDTVITSIRDGFPVDAQGYIRGTKFGTGATVYEDRMFSAANLSPMIPQLQAVADAITT